MEGEAISYIFSTIGCQHTLQPVPEDDFRPPCIPALTTRGFVRWQSVELLLSPSINVPLLQFAVENWHLKHPDTGEPFPSPLPAEAFPSEPDKKIKKWWEDKLESFKEHDPSAEEGPEPEPGPEREPRQPNVKTKSPSSSGSRASPRRTRAVHVSSSDESAESEPIRGRPRGAGGVNYVFAERPAPRHHPDTFVSPTFKDEHIPQRRRSLSMRTSPTRRRSPDIPRQRPLRRKPSPKVAPVIIPSDESPSPTMRSRATYGSDPTLHKLPLRSSVRHVPPGHGSPHHGSPHHGSPRRGYSPGLRPPVDTRHDDRRKSFPFGGVDKLMNTVSSMLSKTPERRRSSSRTTLHGANNYSRGDDYGHRLDRHSPDADDSGSDSSERGRRRRQKEWERDRDRDRDRFRAEPRGKERYDLDRDRDYERDRDGLRNRGDGLRERDREREREREHIYDDRPLRPAPRRGSPYRRMTSHDAERRHPPDDWMEFEAERGAPRHGPPRRRREGHAYRDGRD